MASRGSSAKTGAAAASAAASTRHERRSAPRRRQRSAGMVTSGREPPRFYATAFGRLARWRLDWARVLLVRHSLVAVGGAERHSQLPFFVVLRRGGPVGVVAA